jgi:hypothetical protein
MRGKKYNRGGQGSKGYGKTNKQDAMEQAMDIKMEMADKPKDIKMKKPDRPKGIIIEFVEEGRNMGGTMKNYRAGGIEGSRLSISMERQEDAGYSPSEADFDKQHTLAAEGIMEVGADVTTIQGHNSRASLGETEGVRGTGAMVKGTKFDGVF